MKTINTADGAVGQDQRVQEALALIRKRAENLFSSGRMMCSESVMAVLNQGLGGGLDRETAFMLSSAQSNGLGGRGCICGALNGGILALGLFFGRRRPGFGNGGQVRALAGKLHDHFKERFGATCCRVLTKPVRSDKKKQHRHCCRMTGIGAAMAAEIIFEQRPQLIDQVDWHYLGRTDSTLNTGLKKAAAFFQR